MIAAVSVSSAFYGIAVDDSYHCFFRCNITTTASGVTVRPFTTMGNNSHIYYCYAANKVNLGESSSYIYGLTNISSDNVASFYDADIVGATCKDSSYGVTTAELKSIDWLKDQSWATVSDEYTTEIPFDSSQSTSTTGGSSCYPYFVNATLQRVSAIFTLSDSTTTAKTASVYIKNDNYTTVSNTAKFEESETGDRMVTVDVGWTLENQEITVQFSGSNAKIKYNTSYTSPIVGKGEMFISSSYRLIFEYQVDACWILDNNNAGYPWTWGFDEIPTGGNAYIKTTDVLVPVTMYLKTKNGLMSLQFLKVKE
jgi:hypothetical protein